MTGGVESKVQSPKSEVQGPMSEVRPPSVRGRVSSVEEGERAKFQFVAKRREVKFGVINCNQVKESEIR